MCERGVGRDGSAMSRLDGSQYGDSEGDRPAHVAPPEAEEADQDSEGVLDLRVLGIDVEDEEAREVANTVYSALVDEHDIQGVAPVLRDDSELVIGDTGEGSTHER
ncbi:hypothetical protein [Halorhabdus rudnickae]|uniref:hypothetical protein n=1 Tax=Halorhabdus rudnickae TaxID=1775544 RepID=UPI001083DAC2|nr:hypothetical protein [Halorhabdus rudnickae]